jgi:transcriptional regulator with XRE-family HTH domain
MEESRQWTRDQLAEWLCAVGQRLREARELLGLDLGGVAKKTGLRVGRIARIELGRAHLLFCEVHSLARLYQVSLDYLAGHTADRKPGGWRANASLDSQAFRRMSEQVRRGARAAARKVLSVDILVREAEDRTAGKLVTAFLTGKVIRKPHAWGSRVGHREALRLSQTRKTKSLDRQDGMAEAEEREEQGTRVGLWVDARELRRAIASRRSALTETQAKVVEAILKHGSVSAAARALDKDKSSARKIFYRALKRLREGR